VTTYKNINGVEKVRLSSYISLDMYDEVEKMAREKNWSISKSIEFMLENYVKWIKKG
jgi:hypothetical protein